MCKNLRRLAYVRLSSLTGVDPGRTGLPLTAIYVSLERLTYGGSLLVAHLLPSITDKAVAILPNGALTWMPATRSLM